MVAVLKFFEISFDFFWMNTDSKLNGGCSKLFEFFEISSDSFWMNTDSTLNGSCSEVFF